METRIVFMGSPDFAVPVLRAAAKEFNVVGVVTQPDRHAGRGRKTLQPPAVKSAAQQLGIPVLQTASLKKEPDSLRQIDAWQPEVIVVAAFGQILRPQVLSLPPYGCVNVHASLLPRWRGAAPINAAILNGDTQTGITIMRMDEGLDTGPILSQRSIPISPEDTAGSLSEKLSPLGANLLVDTLPAYLRGEIEPTIQEEALATYAPMLKKQDGELDPTQPVTSLALKVRAFNPWPGAYITYQDQPLKIHQASAVYNDALAHPAVPGRRIIYQDTPAIGAADGYLLLEVIQPAGKKRMPGKDFLQGARDWS